MTLFELILIALGLSMDCFAVAVGISFGQRLPWRNVLKMALFFGLFQGVMPVIGWVVGGSLREMIASVDHWIAFALLAFIGGKMILESFGNKEEKKSITLTVPVLISLSIATSIDALVTGVGFGMIGVNILEAVIIIVVITFLVTIAGAKLPEKTTFIPAAWAERIGGLVLILIGLKILLDHLGYL